MVVLGVRRRSWLALVGVLCLVGSLLAVGAGPAGGVDGEADNEAVFSACVGAALESRGLTDVVGSFAEDAVNCLAHFGVTQGRTETTYDPGSPVSRWQMALFLKRAAGPAGIGLPANPAAVFTDIGGVFESGRLAINEMAALEIMPGVSGTAFRPDLAVSRAQMALMLDSFLVAAEKGAGLGMGALGRDTDELADVAPDDDVFNDINAVTRREYSAIRRMFELGVARGTSDGRFSPQGLVTRAQMAVFITRMLAHTVARPAGVTLQAAESSVTEGGSVGLLVSVRDSDLMGVPDASVDVFLSTAPEDAFGADGRCSDGDVSALGGSGVCEITSGDETTDPSGDLELSADDLGASTTLWAWTGDAGDRYDADDDEGASIVIAVTKGATKLRITDDMPDGATRLQFGESVEFTLQVVDEDGNPVAKKDESVTVASAETVTRGGTDGSSNTTAATQSYKTDASGKVELTFRQTDPRSGSGNTGDSARLDLDITLASSSTLELDDKTSLGKAGTDGADAADAAAVWQDAAPAATSLTLSQAVSYHEATAAGTGAANTVTAKLTDQYGQGISKATIFFRSDDQEGIGAAGDGLEITFDDFQDFWQDGSEYSVDCEFEYGFLGYIFDEGRNKPLSGPLSGLTAGRCLNGEPKNTNRRTTGRNGAAVFTYGRDSDRLGIETIWASYVLTPASGSTEAEVLLSNRIYHYWAKSADSGSVSGRLLAADAEAHRAVLYAPEGPLMFRYDSNDQLDSINGPDLYANFHAHMGRSADNRPPTHLRVGEYKTKASAVSHLIISREQSTQPSDDVIEFLSDGARIAASDTGVVVMGDGELEKAFIFDGADDNDPQVLGLRTTSDRGATRGSFGQDVAISDDGAVIAVGAPDLRTNFYRGAVYVYTRGPAGVYAHTATLSDIANRSWMRWPAGARPYHEFGSGVDIAGDGHTIVVTAPGDRRAQSAAGACQLRPLPPYAEEVCIQGYIHVFERPAAGWVGVFGGNNPGSPGSFGLLPQGTAFIDSRNAVSVSDDGSVVAVGAPGIRSTDNIVDAGGVYVYVRPANGWSADEAVWPDAKLTLTGADAVNNPEDEFALRIGIGVRISGDGSTVVVPGHNPWNDAWEYHQKLYVFDRPATGWDGGVSDYEVIAPDGAQENEFFGEWADINHDGSEVISGRYMRQDGDFRGSVMLFARSGDGWSLNSEFLGAAAGDGYGRYAVFSDDDAIVAMDRFGGRLSRIKR